MTYDICHGTTRLVMSCHAVCGAISAIHATRRHGMPRDAFHATLQQTMACPGMTWHAITYPRWSLVAPCFGLCRRLPRGVGRPPASSGCRRRGGVSPAGSLMEMCHDMIFHAMPHVLRTASLVSAFLGGPPSCPPYLQRKGYQKSQEGRHRALLEASVGLLRGDPTGCPLLHFMGPAGRCGMHAVPCLATMIIPSPDMIHRGMGCHARRCHACR